MMFETKASGVQRLLCIDVKTGRYATPHVGFCKKWKSHRNLEAWWID